jgi:hypothetical protein
MNRYFVGDNPIGMLDSDAKNSSWRATENEWLGLVFGD